MSSTGFTSIGTGEFLATLRGDLKGAANELFIICPLIEQMFALEVAKITLPSINVRILLRPRSSVDTAMWRHMQSAVNIFQAQFASSDVRTLDHLRANCIIIDHRIFYIGSVNFHGSSLNDSREIYLRGQMDKIDFLSSEAETLWKKGIQYQAPPQNTSATTAKSEGDDKMTFWGSLISRCGILQRNPIAFLVRRRSDRVSTVRPEGS
jgi:PLD-like domain